MRKSSRLAALAVLVIGCSGGEPPAQCGEYIGRTTNLEQAITGLTRHHDLWLDQWLSNEPGPPDTEQVFRQRCLDLGSRFSGFAADLARAGGDSPVRAAAERAERAAGDLRSACMDLAWDSNSQLGEDRAARQARLRSATDALRDATNAARRACGAPEVE